MVVVVVDERELHTLYHNTSDFSGIRIRSGIRG